MYRSKSEKTCFHTRHLKADEQVVFCFKRQSYNKYVSKNNSNKYITI